MCRGVGAIFPVGVLKTARGGGRPRACLVRNYARVFEGVVRSHFFLKGRCVQKSKAYQGTLWNEFTPSNTVAWNARERDWRANKHAFGRVGAVGTARARQISQGEIV